MSELVVGLNSFIKQPYGEESFTPEESDTNSVAHVSLGQAAESEGEKPQVPSP